MESQVLEAVMFMGNYVPGLLMCVVRMELADLAAHQYGTPLSSSRQAAEMQNGNLKGCLMRHENGWGVECYDPQAVAAAEAEFLDTHKIKNMPVTKRTRERRDDTTGDTRAAKKALP